MSKITWFFKIFFSLWPIFLLTGVYSISYYNIDFVLIPTLFGLGYPFMGIILIACSTGLLEMVGGYIGWSKFRQLMEHWLRDDISFMKKVMGDLKSGGFIDWVKVYFSRKYLRYMVNESHNYEGKSNIKVVAIINYISDKIVNTALQNLKKRSYIIMFIVGIVPMPGPRMVSDIFCGSMRWKKGFIVVLIGSVLKTIGFVFWWSYVLN